MKFNLVIVLVIVMFKSEATLSTITFVNQANTFVFFRKILEVLPYSTSLGLPGPAAILAVSMLSS